MSTLRAIGSLGRQVTRPYGWMTLCLAGLLLGGCRAEQTTSLAERTVRFESEDQLKTALDEVLDHTYQRRHLNLRDHAAWQILHGVLTFKRQFMVRRDDGHFVSAVDYLLEGGDMEGFLVEPVIDDQSGHRGVRAILEKGSKTGQGHYDQWLAILAQSDLHPEETIRVRGQTLTIGDWVAQVQWDMPRNVDREYSWTIVSLTTYLPTDAQWKAQDGRTWSIAELVGVEAEYDLGEGACGGTHRLDGLAIALNRHLAGGGQLAGPWKLADDRINEAMEQARQMQNPDGSFSSNYFERAGHSPDLSARLATTGHVVEFLALAMTDEQIQEPWVRAAVVHLVDILQKAKEVPLECGALYHATRGLLLYRQRLYGPRSFSPADISQSDGIAPLMDGSRTE